jgi:hypothetical protein
MKKIVTASLIALAATAASAAEIGVIVARDYSGADRNGQGLSLGTTVGGFGVKAAFERTTKGANDQDRMSLTASRELLKVGGVSLAATAGVAHLNNQTGASGYAMTVGAGASLPLTKTMAATVDVTRQYGQDRVEAFNGNRVTVGIKHSF